MKTRILFGLASVLSLVTVAQAHTHLSSSEPADGSVVVTSPTNFVAHFSEPTRVTALTIAREAATRRRSHRPAMQRSTFRPSSRALSRASTS